MKSSCEKATKSYEVFLLLVLTYVTPGFLCMCQGFINVILTLGLYLSFPHHLSLIVLDILNDPMTQNLPFWLLDSLVTG